MGGRTLFRRPHGLVENSFSYDGDDHEGRADLSLFCTLNLEHQLSQEELLERLILVWASLRLQHVLLMARVHEQGREKQRWFEIRMPDSIEEVLEDAKESMLWVKEQGASTNLDDFFIHASNTARLVDSSKSLSRLLVLPPVSDKGSSQTEITLGLVMSHEITDGMSGYNWTSHLIRLLNTSSSALRHHLDRYRTRSEIKSRLPSAQEDLYPLIPGTSARQMWFWAVLRVLRHVRKPLPASFANPTRKAEWKSPPLEPSYTSVLDYSPNRKPPNSSGYARVHLNASTMANISRLTSSVGGTLGAACFALVALAMMELYEERNPSMDLSSRRPMTMSFPMNPKPYFNYNRPSESCMLSFGDTFILPFLSSSLPREGRFKLLLRQCQRKLEMYQKRVRSPSENVSLAKYSPTWLLANGYLLQLDRLYHMRRPNGERRANYDPQGGLESNVDESPATNGVSNVGSLKHFFDEEALAVKDDERSTDLIAKMTSLKGGVRAREGEFLVGSSSGTEGLDFNVSYDASCMDEEWVEKWKQKMETILAPENVAKL